MIRRALLIGLLLKGCDRGSGAPTAAPTVALPAASGPTTAAPTASSPSPAVASATATAEDVPATVWTKTLSADLRADHVKLTASLRKGLPKDSADYAEALALVMMHGRGDIDFEALKKAVVARGLPPHPLGNGYLLVRPPPPAPGQTFDPAIMPRDWVDTWGEVAMAYLLGELTKPQYEALERAAYPSRP